MDNMSNDDFGNLEEPVAVPQTGEPEPSTSELLVLAIDDEAIVCWGITNPYWLEKACV